MVIRALDYGIDRDGRAPAGTQHTTKFRQASHRVGKEHQSEIAEDRVEALAGNESACPSSMESDTFSASPRRSCAFATIAGETSAAVMWPVGPTAGRAASAESPVPVATSRTRMPGTTPAARNRKGMKYAVTC